jgi:hypothetical protein
MGTRCQERAPSTTSEAAVCQLLLDHFVRDLTRCETEIGRLPVGGSNQAFGHQEEGREDQGVDNRDRDYASGKAAVVVIKVRP